ncbi:hypothetical protein BAY1663_04363 [Pseudomonas sp. BAY1663]|nr:hypothetical protein BAY1663_04363 [Pseudomonas sp. BAY1663]
MARSYGSANSTQQRVSPVKQEASLKRIRSITAPARLLLPAQASGFKPLSLPRAIPISPSRQATPPGKARNEGLR